MRSESILHSFKEWSIPHDMIFSPSRSKSCSRDHSSSFKGPLWRRSSHVRLSTDRAEDFITVTFYTSKYGHQSVCPDVPQAKSVICGESTTT